MYLLKATHPNYLYPLYLTTLYPLRVEWSNRRKVARRFKAKEVIPIYQELSTNFRTDSLTIEIVRGEV